MAAFDRPLEDPLVEKLLVEAILRINDDVKTEARRSWPLPRFARRCRIQTS